MPVRCHLVRGDSQAELAVVVQDEVFHLLGYMVFLQCDLHQLVGYRTIGVGEIQL